jgi:hypothetical protein
MQARHPRTVARATAVLGHCSVRPHAPRFLPGKTNRTWYMRECVWTVSLLSCMYNNDMMAMTMSHTCAHAQHAAFATHTRHTHIPEAGSVWCLQERRARRSQQGGGGRLRPSLPGGPQGRAGVPADSAG